TLYVRKKKKAGLHSCALKSCLGYNPVDRFEYGKTTQKHIAHLLSLMEARDIAGCLDILSGSKGSQISYQSISDSDNDFVGVGDPAYYLRIVDNT
ncbi:hypothetical protein GJ496_011571, partial [Pomphorhynchus laevis]